MKINKEQEVVMEIHKKKDSKVHKKSDGKVKSKMTSARTKGKAIAGEAGSVIADNIEGGDNLKASLEVGREVSKPVRDTVAAGNRLRKRIKNSKLNKETAGNRLRKQASSKGKKLVEDRFKKSAKKTSKKATKKVAKSTTKKIAKNTSKLAVKTGAKVGATAAGSAAGPYGMAIGAAVGKAAEMQIDTAVYKTEKKMRMLKYFKDKLQTPENQNDNIIKVAVDLVKMKAGLMIRRAVSMLAPIVIPIIIIIAAVGGLVMAIFTVLYNSPLAFLLPRLSDGETIHSVSTQYVAEFNERVQKRADEHKDADEGRVIYVDYEGVSETPSNYYDIMCVYMVRYGYKNTAMDMNASNKGKLQQVVNDMCHFTTEVVTETKGKGKNKKTTKILEVRVTLKTYNDMISEYQFSEDQIKMLQTLMSACNGRSSPSGGGSSPSNLQSSLSEKEIKKYTDKISDAKQKKAVEFALSKVGYEYSQARRFSGTAFDCSSLAYCAWKAAGIDISYNDATTAAAEAEGLEKKTVSQSDLKPGDLIFYSYTRNGRYKNISHVGIYVGDGKMVEAMDDDHGVVFGDYHNKGLVMICRPRK